MQNGEGCILWHIILTKLVHEYFKATLIGKSLSDVAIFLMNNIHCPNSERWWQFDENSTWKN